VTICYYVAKSTYTVGGSTSLSVVVEQIHMNVYVCHVEDGVAGTNVWDQGSKVGVSVYFLSIMLISISLTTL
jgi:hypothetical protein